MFRPDGSLLPHHQCPMADVLRTGISVREQEVHIERPDGVRGIALVDIEAIKDIDGNVVGAVNCFQDITERKRSEAQIVNLAHEAEHRTKNILSTVLATVRLSHSDTSDDLKRLIEGRINALARVHGLFVQSRWTGAELHNLVTQELSPYCGQTVERVRIDGPPLLLEPNTAQTIAISLHELATNAAKYGSLSVADGRVEIAWSRTADGRLSLRWIESGGPADTPPAHRGFGTRVMENIIAHQLRGEVHFDWREQGLVRDRLAASIGRAPRWLCGSPPMAALLKPSMKYPKDVAPSVERRRLLMTHRGRRVLAEECPILRREKKRGLDGPAP